MPPKNSLKNGPSNEDSKPVATNIASPVKSVSPAKAKTLISKFASPSKKQITKVQQNKNRLHIEALDGGFLVSWFDNGSNVNIGAYCRPHFDLLFAHDEMKTSIGINDVVFRRGPDGNTPLPSNPNQTWNWHCMVSIIGECNIDNNAYKTLCADGIVGFFNDFTFFINKEYRYPRTSTFFRDHTVSPPRKISSVLLDHDVIALMKAAYPDHSLQDLLEYEDIVDMYWDNANHGRQVMQHNP